MFIHSNRYLFDKIFRHRIKAPMKKVLSLLVIFVFLNVQCWAYTPNYPTTTADLSGTYAGVLIPNNPSGAVNAASIGIFGVGIPSPSTTTVVVAQGAAVLFVQGAAYNATVTGVLDPESNTLSAIVEGISSFSQVVANAGVAVTIATYFYAQGNIIATLEPAPQVRGLANSTGPGSAGAERLTGTSTIDLYQKFNAADGTPLVTNIVTYSVSGFQQTNTYSVPAVNITPAGSAAVNG
jgi:hypothetical protein